MPRQIRERLHREACKIAVLLTVTIHAQKNTAVDIPFFMVARFPVFIVRGAQRRKLPGAARRIDVKLHIAVEFQIALRRIHFHFRHRAGRKQAEHTGQYHHLFHRVSLIVVSFWA